MKPRALLSVYDKTGITDFASALAALGWELVSTGGTARALRSAGLDVLDVSEVTGHREMMDGRVKTLHPAVHAGLLARRDRPDDLEALEGQGYRTIDLVAVNLYPFRETVARPGVTPAEAVEQIDIGGPTMIRSAAKNHADVWVVVDPADYGAVLEALRGGEAATAAALRRRLAAKVFEHVSAYDAAIADYLGGLEDGRGAGPEALGGELDREEGDAAGEGEAIPERLTLSLVRRQALRYGENPGQAAGFYAPEGSSEGLAGLEQKHGKELSYNNLLDVDGALLSLAPFAFSPRAAVCIVKHTTPCGLAVGDTLLEAYRRALATDPTSAFGSVIAVNRTLDGATAEAMSSLFIECIVAPGFEPGALEVLTRKKNLRLLVTPGVDEPVPGEPSADDAWWAAAEADTRAAARFLAAHNRRPHARVARGVYGGVLVQTPPAPPFYGSGRADWRVATAREPDAREWDDLRFAWAAVFGIKSNAILLARDGATVGIGAGQMSRVDASRIAVMKAADAGLSVEGAVLASDAFFPFRDGVDAAAEAGVRAIVQPGGSIRDEEVIAAADEHGIAMVFTRQRLFRH